MTGFVNVWKKEGTTSTYVVNRVKRFAKDSCGHMGTLDPLASGILPVGIGNATRLFDYFLDKSKTYIARFRFGVTSVSLDRESPLEYGGRVPSQEEIEAVLPRFVGEIDQVPPAYSAKCVNGMRSYEYARLGHEVELKSKKVKIESFRFLEQLAPDEFSFEIVCGGGTYIRSLARDLAEALGTKGFMNGLARTQSGVFTKETAVPLEELTKENFSKYIIPTDEVLPYPSIDSTDEKLYNGLKVPCGEADGLYKLYQGGVFYGLARVKEGLLKTEKKLC